MNFRTTLLIAIAIFISTDSQVFSQVVYNDDNFTTSALFTACEQGSVIELGPGFRDLSYVQIGLDKQSASNNGTVDILFNLYDVGADGDPENQLFQTFLDDFVLPSDIEFWVTVDLGRLTVPDQIGWTVQLSDQTSPASVGRVGTSGPDVGTHLDGKFRCDTSSDVWTDLSSSSGFRAVSVPEPGTAGLLAFAVVGLLRRSRRLANVR